MPKKSAASPIEKRSFISPNGGFLPPMADA